MNEKMMNGKDLVNIGIYAAIYKVVNIVLSMLGYLPIFMVLLDILVPLIGATPFMLFITKVNKFGMIWIFSIIIGILMAFTGMGFYSIFTSIICGLAADLIAKSGKYQSKIKMIFVTTVFSGWVWGNFLPFFINRDNLLNYDSAMGRGYGKALSDLLPNWMCPVLLVAAFVTGFIGALIGQKLLKKHFNRAGIV